MKKTILVFAAACISVAIIPSLIKAQGIKNQVGLTGSQTAYAPIQAVPFSFGSFDLNTATESDVNSINVKAIKDFKGRFLNAKDEKWFTVKDGFMSYFTMDGFGDRAYYDKKGRWLYSLKFNSEKNIPHDIRAAVKSVYYDFAITIVEIVEVPGQTVYLVHLEDASNIKIVRVSEDAEMNILEEYTKG